MGFGARTGQCATWGALVGGENTYQVVARRLATQAAGPYVSQWGTYVQTSSRSARSRPINHFVSKAPECEVASKPRAGRQASKDTPQAPVCGLWHSNRAGHVSPKSFETAWHHKSSATLSLEQRLRAGSGHLYQTPRGGREIFCNFPPIASAKTIAHSSSSRPLHPAALNILDAGPTKLLGTRNCATLLLEPRGCELPQWLPPSDSAAAAKHFATPLR